MRQCPLCGRSLEGSEPSRGLDALAEHFAADCPKLPTKPRRAPDGRDRSG